MAQKKKNDFLVDYPDRYSQLKFRFHELTALANKLQLFNVTDLPQTLKEKTSVRMTQHYTALRLG